MLPIVISISALHITPARDLLPPQFTGEGIKAERMSILPSARLQSTLELGLRQNCLIWEHVLPLACVTRPLAALATLQLFSTCTHSQPRPPIPHGWLCFLMRAQALESAVQGSQQMQGRLARNLSLTDAHPPHHHPPGQRYTAAMPASPSPISRHTVCISLNARRLNSHAGQARHVLMQRQTPAADSEPGSLSHFVL